MVAKYVTRKFAVNKYGGGGSLCQGQKSKNSIKRYCKF